MNEIVNTTASIAPQTMEEKKRLFSVVNNATSLNDYLNEIPSHTVHVVYLAVSKGIRKGRNGAPDVDCINSYLVTADGEALMSQSAGIAQSVQALISAFGQEVDFELKVIQQNTKSGNMIKKLDFAH